MKSNKKKTIIIIIVLGSIALVIGIGFGLFQLVYRLFKFNINDYEEKWSIDLPDGMKIQYKSTQIYSDERVEYIVLRCEQAPESELFNQSMAIEKDTFEDWFNQAANGIELSNRPDFSRHYDYMVLEEDRNNRIEYLFIVFYPDTMKIIICQQTRQYPHGS
jgi:hypothetical protein